MTVAEKGTRASYRAVIMERPRVLIEKGSSKKGSLPATMERLLPIEIINPIGLLMPVPLTFQPFYNPFNWSRNFSLKLQNLNLVPA